MVSKQMAFERCGGIVENLGKLTHPLEVHFWSSAQKRDVKHEAPCVHEIND